MSITAKEIIHSIGRSARPEYYSGRGATTTDLNGDKLFAIYTKITEEIGEKEAEAFVTMIENLKYLSMTNFLNALYALESNQWVYKPVVENDIDIGPDNSSRGAVALGIIGSAILGKPDETEHIKRPFFSMIEFNAKIELRLSNDGRTRWFTKNGYRFKLYSFLVFKKE